MKSRCYLDSFLSIGLIFLIIGGFLFGEVFNDLLYGLDVDNLRTLAAVIIFSIISINISLALELFSYKSDIRKYDETKSGSFLRWWLFLLIDGNNYAEWKIIKFTEKNGLPNKNLISKIIILISALSKPVAMIFIFVIWRNGEVFDYLNLHEDKMYFWHFIYWVIAFNYLAGVKTIYVFKFFKAIRKQHSQSISVVRAAGVGLTTLLAVIFIVVSSAFLISFLENHAV